MSNGEVCCILGVCCPPGSAAQREALVHMIQKSHPHKDAEKAADRVLALYDSFKETAAAIEQA